MELPGTAKARAMQVSEDVLRRMHFRIDKYDAQAGFIQTRPLSGGQFFEVWRQDNASARAVGESSLHSLRRTVQIRFDDRVQPLKVSCQVNVERLCLPEMRVAGMSQAAALYTDSHASLQQLELNAEQARNMAWIDLGRDGDLEGRIVERIGDKLRRLEGLK